MKKTKKRHIKIVKPLTIGRDLRRRIIDSQRDLIPFKTKTPIKKSSPEMEYLKRFNPIINSKKYFELLFAK